MVITGQFRDIHENLYTVEIDNPSVSGDTVVIGEHYGSGEADNDLMYFADDTVETASEAEDMFTAVIMGSATVNLQTREFVGDRLFANNARSATVKIMKGNDTVFDGYVQPGTFDQPFTNPYDMFTINCIDKLATLQYYKYRGITPDTLDAVRKQLDYVTFMDVIDMTLGPMVQSGGTVYYDMSKGISSTRENLVFSDLKIAEQTFVGDDYDSVWTDLEVLTEILQYLNLHIRQVGSDFYIFDWDSIRERRTEWVDLFNNEYTETNPQVVQINSSTNAGTSTTVSIDDVYNQVSVTCSLNGEDSVIESPLDGQTLTSPFVNKQLYLTEYISEGEGVNAINGFNDMLTGTPTEYDAAKRVDWYVQWLESKNWNLYAGGTELRDLYETDSYGQYYRQYKIAQRQGTNAIEPALVGLGSIETEVGRVTDDSPKGYVKLSNYMFISLLGNEDDGDNTTYPTQAVIQANAPVAEYISTQSAAVFSPSDSETTNYLVFSGKLMFTPKQHETAPYSVCMQATRYEEIPHEYWTDSPAYHRAEAGIYQLWHKTIPSDNNDDGRYYTRKFYAVEYPNDNPESASTMSYGLMPPTQYNANRKFQYNYSQAWNDNDTISNLDVLECELIIGNKRLVQWYDGSTTRIEWVTLGHEPVETFTEDGEPYTVTTFQLGINPKIDDYIIGTEFDIRSNVDYTMNINATGFAVPIKQSDALSGQVLFRILGPVNTKWNQITRRHPSFWRHTKYYEDWHYILAHCENIAIKDFKCRLMSDNAGYSSEYSVDDKDLVYMSNETNSYVERKDDISFRIITQPTTQEALSKGIKNQANYNAVMKSTDNMYLSRLWNDNTKDSYKPEEHYVSQYYTYYHRPKVVLQTEMWNDGNVAIDNTYAYSQLNRQFMVRSMKAELAQDKVTMTLVEI